MKESNFSASSPTTVFDEKEVTYYFVIFPGLLVIFDVFSLAMMLSAPRIAKNIRYMCCNIIFYDLFILITFALRNSLNDHPKWYFSRASQLSILGEYVAVTGFSVERLLAINSPYLYHRHFKTAYVKAFVLVELSLFSTLIAYIWTYNWERERAIRVCYGASVLHTTLSVICTFCSVKALIVYKKSLLKVNVTINGIRQRVQHLSRGKQSLSVFCLLFVLLHIPLGIELIVRRCDLIPTEYMHTIYVILFNVAIDPLIYLWRFRECRLQGLKCLSLLPCFRFLKNYTERMKMEIYNIPIAERRNDQDGVTIV